MIDHRGAIDLSINMIVVIIISLAILVGGIVLLTNLIGGAEDIKRQLDQQTEERLDQLLVEQGKPVVLAFPTATVRRGENHLFGLGILNVGEVGTRFKLQVEFDKSIDQEGNEQSIDVNPVAWVRYDSEELILAEGGKSKQSILIKVPNDAPSGQYLFKAKAVLPAGETYGNVQRFYVTVK